MILKVGDLSFQNFNEFNIDLRYDSIASSFSFRFFFDPSKHKSIHNFRGYTRATVEHNGERLITGRIVTHQLSSQPKKQWNTVAGYSLTGILEDCNIPPSLYPIQTSGLSLRQIASRIIEPFGLSMRIDPFVFPVNVSLLMDIPYDEILVSETDTIKSYLASLAAQRGIILSHNENGELHFTRARVNTPSVLDIDEGGVPGLSMTLNVNGQGIYSQITVLKDVDPDFGASEELTSEIAYSSILRSQTKTISAGDDADLSLAVKSAIGQSLKNIKLTLSFDRWDINGKIIKPNSIITVKSKELLMNNKTKWFVESVNLKGDNTKLTSTLTCYLPEVYTGETPKYVFG